VLRFNHSAGRAAMQSACCQHGSAPRMAPSKRAVPAAWLPRVARSSQALRVAKKVARSVMQASEES